MSRILKLLIANAGTNGRSIWTFLKDVYTYNPFKTLLSIILVLVKSISSGISLLLIIPLLHVIGFSFGSSEASAMDKIISKLFLYTHLPLNLPTVLVTYVVIVSLAAVITYTEQWMSSSLQTGFCHYLRSQLYRFILEGKWSFLLQIKKSTLVHNLTTQIQMISAAHISLLGLINNAILLGVYCTLALLLSWQMTLIAMIAGMLLLGMLAPLHKLTASSGHKNIERNKALLHTVSEQLTALKIIKVSGFEDKFIHDTNNISLALEKQNQYFFNIVAATKLIYSVGLVIVFSLLLYFALIKMLISLTSLMLLLIVFSRILPRVSIMQQYYQRILHQLPAYHEVKYTIKLCSDNQEHLTSTNQSELLFNDAIHLDNVSYSYPNHNEVPIIQQLTLQIKKNTTTAIIGPSGSGKTTLADLIVGLLSPSTGQIRIDSKILNNSNKLAWRKSIAYVTQDHFLHNASIRYNLQLFSSNKTDEQLWSTLRSAAAFDFVANLPHGLDTVIGDEGHCLSGGERQRIVLARALLSNPKLLILDECTNALDKNNILHIQKALNQLRGKITILIIAHQLEMRDFADQKVLLGSIKQTAIPHLFAFNEEQTLKT